MNSGMAEIASQEESLEAFEIHSNPQFYSVNIE